MIACPCCDLKGPVARLEEASWLCWTLSDREADLSVRERAARCWEVVAAKRPVILLHTCQRVEIYASPCEFLRLSALPLLQAARCLRGEEVFSHLIRVTAGWNSIVEGESEIQGQVRRAYQHASAVHILPSSLHYLFQKSLRAGKRLRQQLGERPERLEQHIVERLASSSGLQLPVGFVGASTLNARILQRAAPLRSKAMLFSRFAPTRGVFTNVPRYSLQEAMEAPRVRALVVSSTAEQLWIDRIHPDCRLVIDCSAPPRVDPCLRGKVEFLTLETLHQTLRQESALTPPLIQGAESLAKHYADGWRRKQVKGSLPC